MPMVQARNPIPHTAELPEGQPDVSGRPDPAVGAFASLRRTHIARQYVGYIDKLEAGQTARLTAYPVS